jgi:hypothetical protein
MDHDEDEDEIGYAPRVVPTADPAALAIASLVLATLSLSGFGLLNGASYVYPLGQNAGEATRVALAGLLGAGFALVPVLLAAMAQRRTHPGDPSWVPRLAQAGLLLGLLAFVLRLVMTATTLAEVAGGGSPWAPL